MEEIFHLCQKYVNTRPFRRLGNRGKTRFDFDLVHYLRKGYALKGLGAYALTKFDHLLLKNAGNLIPTIITGTNGVGIVKKILKTLDLNIHHGYGLAIRLLSLGGVPTTFLIITFIH